MPASENPAYILLTATETAAMIRVPLPILVDWQNFPGIGPEYLFVNERMMFRLDAVHSWIDSRSTVPLANAGQELKNKVQLGRVG